jgi:molybdopterin molybdotransferase
MTSKLSHRSPNADIRMRGFSHRVSVDDALDWLTEATAPLDAEHVSLDAAAGRVTAAHVVSNQRVPDFARSMMDGYAVRAEDTEGASTYNPLRLKIVGEILPGAVSDVVIKAGHAIRIMTGAAVPQGASGVLPAEYAEEQNDEVLVHATISPGKHVGQPGEDIQQGDVVLPVSRVLRPQDVGLLSSIGAAEVSVVRRPRVRIVITGDELLPAGTPPHGCKIPDANGPMLSALVRRDGGEPEVGAIVADDPDAVLQAMQSDADVVLVSGGSSVGQEDHAPRLLAEHGELAIHGIAMRPSSPTGMGRLGRRLVFLLPGNPVSCLCAYDFFAGRAIRKLGGRNETWPYRTMRGPLVRKISSAIGRLDYARVQCDDAGIVPLAVSGASILSSTTRADGFVIVPADSEGFAAETEVEVLLYD